MDDHPVTNHYNIILSLTIWIVVYRSLSGHMQHQVSFIIIFIIQHYQHVYVLPVGPDIWVGALPTAWALNYVFALRYLLCLICYLINIFRPILCQNGSNLIIVFTSNHENTNLIKGRFGFRTLQIPPHSTRAPIHEYQNRISFRVSTT